MKYLFLIYEDEQLAQKMPKAEIDQVNAEYFAFIEDTEKSGNLLAGDPLQPTHTATTVRVRKGKTTMTDGPFAETKEQLGGYFLVEAADLNEAIKLASKIPAVRTGSIEVRPILVF
jgi:hypothetical protein